MPLIDMSTQEAWDSLYGDTSSPGPRFTRATMPAIFGEDGVRLRQALGLIAGQHVILIGSAFGWIAEEWAQHGIGVVCCDPSLYIQHNKSAEAVLLILDEDCLTQASRDRVVADLGSAPDMVISEDVLPILSDAEVPVFLGACRAFGVAVAHWISPETPSGVEGLNWKSIEEWKGLVSPDIVVRRGASEVS